MKKVTMVIATAIILSASSTMAGPVYYFNDSSGATYRICNDSDGYIVYKPNGSQDAWGTGYTWSDVISAYDLGGWHTKTGHYNNCP